MKKSPSQKQHIDILLSQKRVSSHLLVFQSEDTHKSQLLDIEIDSNRQFHDMSNLFQRFCPLQEHQVSIYNPETNHFSKLNCFGLNTLGVLPNYLLEPRVILIRYKKLTKQHKLQQQDVFLIIKSKNEQKSKERTIKQAISLVKQWRKRYQQMQRDGSNSKNLCKIAQQLGVNKKTLDDYYYHLRVGEFYSFQFQNHLCQKIGVLRNFVRHVKPKMQTKGKYFRHPKFLKLISEKIKNLKSYETDDYLKQSVQFPVSTDFDVPDAYVSESRQYQEESWKKVQFFLKYSPGSVEDSYSNDFQQYSDDFNSRVIKLKEIKRYNKDGEIDNYFLRRFKQVEDI